LRTKKYIDKIRTESDNTIEIIEYNGSRVAAKAKCIICGNEWSYRADHLLSKCFCPHCKKDR
jgi:hypothetical protein